MKIPGIVGGLGPETSADFYLQLNHLAEQANAELRPACHLWNVPLPYALEEAMLLGKGGIEDYKPYLEEATKTLEAAGADFIVVPCNTVHELYEAYSSVVSVPVLHIVEETVTELRERQIDRVSLLATGQTIQSRLYQRLFEKAGVSYDIPEPRDQKTLNEIVTRLVKSGEATDQDTEWMDTYVTDAAKRTGAIVLGCTDFHILVKEQTSSGVTVVDSMSALARATFNKMST